MWTYELYVLEGEGRVARCAVPRGGRGPLRFMVGSQPGLRVCVSACLPCVCVCVCVCVLSFCSRSNNMKLSALVRLVLVLAAVCVVVTASQRPRRKSWRGRARSALKRKGGRRPRRPAVTKPLVKVPPPAANADDAKDTFLADAVKKYDCDAKKIPRIMVEAAQAKLKISMNEVQSEFKGCAKLRAAEESKGVATDKDQDTEDHDLPAPLAGDPKMIFRTGFTSKSGWAKRWEEPVGRFARVVPQFSDKKSVTDPVKFVGNRDAMVMDGNFGASKLKPNARCKSASLVLGRGKTALQCAELVAARGGSFFSLGQKKSECFLELTKRRDCPEGFKEKEPYDFYEVSQGASLSGNGARTATTKPFNAKEGGNVAFDISLGPENGNGKCWQTFQTLVAKEKERMARKQKEFDEKLSCESGKQCHGHGLGMYSSTCDVDWHCKRSCTCKCNMGYMGTRCEKRFSSASCSSSGDPHPVSADGARYNIYDAGEWVWFKHPDVDVEVHLLTRMATGRIAATAGFAVKKGKDTVIVESPHCANGGGDVKIFIREGNTCKKISSGARYKTKNSGIEYSGRSVRIDGFNARVGGVWWYRWHGGCGRHGWLNAYLNIRAPRDGRSIGMCGPFNGNRGTDYNQIRNSGGHRHHGQWSTSYRDAVRIPSSRTFFRCGVHGMPRFQQLAANSKENMRAMRSAVAMEMDRDLAALGGDKNVKDDDAKDMFDKAKAIAKCKQRKDIVTAEALAECAEDMAKTGDVKMEEVAAKSSEESIWNAMQSMEANEKDEILELVAEAKMKVPQPMDAVLQWCSDSCGVEKNWKQLKAYPLQVYNDFLTDGKWARMTARIPDAAKSPNLQLRFYQKTKKCFCCNPFAVSNLKVKTGGWTVAIVADKAFKLFADGRFVGKGSWWDPAKDTYRYRVNPSTKVYAVEVEGGADAKMGVIGSFGPSIVTSSTWRCTYSLTPEEKKGNKWARATFDDSKWPSAVEEGDNGILPWGPRPGIAKKAKWIFTHDAYKMRGAKAYCRVIVKDAWHSYSKDHPAASRWSCKNNQNRQSPFAMQLNSDVSVGTEVESGKEGKEVQAPGVSFNTVLGKDGVAQEVLFKIAVRKIMDRTMEGGMIKRSVIRFKVLDPSPQPIKVCKIIRPWNPKEVTYNTKPAYDGAGNCVTIRATTKNEWVRLDVSEWMRAWVTDPSTNFGMAFIATGNDNVGLVSQLDPDANERPRLSMSCHGDQVPYEVVFKASEAKLVPATKK